MGTDAKEVEKILAEKNPKAEEVLVSINSVHEFVEESANLAQAAYDKANEAKTRSQSESEQVDELTKKIDVFLKAEHATPEQVKEVAQECLDSEMLMDADQIKALADEINAATDSVKNVDKINQETAQPLQEAESLKAQTVAEGAKSLASKANSDLYALNSKFRTVSESLTQKEDKIGSAKARALGLQRRANKLSNSASQKLADLLDMEKQYEENQKELELLSESLTKMNCQMQIHLKVIQSKSAWYMGCMTPSKWSSEEDCTCPNGETEPQC